MNIKKNPQPKKFLQKLYYIVSLPTLDHIISWDDQGESFLIKNVNVFESTLMKETFKMQAFTSFKRQLNMYDFSKVKSSAQSLQLEFSNPFFKKD